MALKIAGQTALVAHAAQNAYNNPVQGFDKAGHMIVGVEPTMVV